MDNFYQTTPPNNAENPGPAASQPPPPEPPKDKPTGDEENVSSALLPISLIGEAEPGDTITLRVVNIYEDEVEVAPVGSQSKTTESDKEIEDLEEE